LRHGVVDGGVDELAAASSMAECWPKTMVLGGVRPRADDVVVIVRLTHGV
jgi:hypothetical protein